jgi:hypothetical protein
MSDLEMCTPAAVAIKAGMRRSASVSALPCDVSWSDDDCNLFVLCLTVNDDDKKLFSTSELPRFLQLYLEFLRVCY